MSISGLLRDYLEWYLRTHPEVNADMTLMVRQMAPTQSGLPVQLYFFIRETAWVKYEHIQADIFDYVYAVVRKVRSGHLSDTVRDRYFRARIAIASCCHIL